MFQYRRADFVVWIPPEQAKDGPLTNAKDTFPPRKSERNQFAYVIELERREPVARWLRQGFGGDCMIFRAQNLTPFHRFEASELVDDVLDLALVNGRKAIRALVVDTAKMPRYRLGLVVVWIGPEAKLIRLAANSFRAWAPRRGSIARKNAWLLVAVLRDHSSADNEP